MISIRYATVISAFLTACFFSSSSYGATAGQADTSIKAYNTVYWNASNKTYYKLDNKSGLLDYWMWAHAWECEMDAYERTKDTAYFNKMKDNYTGFAAKYGLTMSNNNYNDDIAWWILAATRAYDLTSDTLYKSMAKKNFDWMLSTQWDTVYGGGIWWKNKWNSTDVRQKNACSTIPMAIAGFKLAKQLNDSTYAAKAKSLLLWVIKRMYRPTGEIADRIQANGTRDSVVWGPLSYTHGIFIDAAYQMFLSTKDSTYFKDAIATCDYFHKVKCDSLGIMPDEAPVNGTANNINDAGMYKTVFVHYLMRFLIDAKQTQYLPWMTTNATSMWKNRRTSDNLMWFRWSTPAPTATGTNGIGAHMATGMVALLNLLVVAQNSPPVSVHQNVKSPSPALAGSRIALQNGLQIYSLTGRRINANEVQMPGIRLVKTPDGRIVKCLVTKDNIITR